MQNNVVGWFEIPVTDMGRAIKFYETVFDFKIQQQDMGEFIMGWFPMVQGGLGTPGALAQHKEFYKPTNDGVLVYFTAHSGDLNNELSRVEAAGGKVTSGSNPTPCDLC